MQYGEEIDKHQLVMRINNAPTVGFETFAGTKTNLRYQNERYMGFREFASDVLMGRYTPVPVGPHGSLFFTAHHPCVGTGPSRASTTALPEPLP